MSYLLLILGFVLLVKGADWFVDGSSSIAKKLNVSSIIIGLTIVAFGTSMPEAAVSVTAAISGQNDIALGNIIGSNIFNLLMVGGLCSIICPLTVDKGLLKKEYPLSVFAVILLLGLVMVPWTSHVETLMVSRTDGLILLLFFIFFLVSTIYSATKQKKANVQEESTGEKQSWLKSIILSVVGVAGVVVGGDLVVDSAVEIATQWGVSQAVIGLTIVAIGTSLPELVTSLVAAKKGERDLAVGNIVGSNIFNVFFILGASAAIHPIAVTSVVFTDMILLVAISIYSYVLSCTGKIITRIEGVSMVAIYVAYMAYLLIR